MDFAGCANRRRQHLRTARISRRACRATEARFRIVGAFLTAVRGRLALYERPCAGARTRQSHAAVLQRHRAETCRRGIPRGRDLTGTEGPCKRLALEPSVAATPTSDPHRSLECRICGLSWREAGSRPSYTYVVPLDRPAPRSGPASTKPEAADRGAASARASPTARTTTSTAVPTALRHTAAARGAALPSARVSPATSSELAELGLARLGHAVFDGKVIASQLMLTGPHPGAQRLRRRRQAYLRMGANAFLRWHAFGHWRQAVISRMT